MINPATGRIVSGPRYNGIVLPGDGFDGDGNDLVGRAAIRRCWRSSAASRAASRRRTTTCSSRALGVVLRDQRQDDRRASSAGVFHNRVTLNDSIAARRQPAVPAEVTVANGSVGQPGRRAAAPRTCRSACRGRTSVFKHPTAYTWSAGVQREVPFGLRRRRRPTSAAAGCTCSASATSTSCSRARSRPTRASTSRRCVPTRATARSASSENAGRSIYNSLQLSADRRYTQRLQVRRRLHARQVRGQRAATSATSSGTRYDDTNFWGASSFDRTARAERLLHLRPAVLARPGRR